MPGSEKSKFHDLTVDERVHQISQESQIGLGELDGLTNNGGLTAQQADHMVENAIGVFGLPLGVARNFLINGREVLVPMAVEEPSVIAGASFMAKLARNGGGFKAETSAPEMIGQLQLLDIADLEKARQNQIGRAHV